LNGKELTNWRMYSLPMTSVPYIKFDKQAKPDVPMLKRGTFTLQETGDTYLDMRNWGKGCVWVNGHNLGRYWEIGPQQTIYVPAEWLKKGRNEVVVFEMLTSQQTTLTALDKPILNELRK